MTDVVNPKSSSPDQLLPYHKKISAEDKALMVYFISYTYMVLKAAQELQEMEKRALLAEKQRDDALDKVKELRIHFYETAARLEEEQG